MFSKKLVNVIDELAKFADEYKAHAYTWHLHISSRHSQQQLVREQLYGCRNLMMDLEDLEYVLGSLKLLGSKGTTGTQASFLELFDGDQETIDKIDPMIAEKTGI